MDRIILVTTTVGSEEAAAKLGQDALREGLAACAQVEADIKSTFRWDGCICTESESRLTLKAAPAVREALLTWLRANHPYETAQILWWEVHSANPAYTKWVLGE